MRCLSPHPKYTLIESYWYNKELFQVNCFHSVEIHAWTDISLPSLVWQKSSISPKTVQPQAIKDNLVVSTYNFSSVMGLDYCPSQYLTYCQGLKSHKASLIEVSFKQLRSAAQLLHLAFTLGHICAKLVLVGRLKTQKYRFVATMLKQLETKTIHF